MIIPYLIFATNNVHKADEIRHVLNGTFAIKALQEAGITIEIPEPHDTLEANATEKSTVIHRLTGSNCFGEDSGLEVMALNGEPGVKSARYAVDDSNFPDNIAKLLHKMHGITDRAARFRTIISLVLDGTEYQFEGTCPGEITRERMGSSGFGYDPIFKPLGSDKTFGQMSLEEKSIFSHRKKATDKLITFLKNYNGKSEIAIACT